MSLEFGFGRQTLRKLPLALVSEIAFWVIAAGAWFGLMQNLRGVYWPVLIVFFAVCTHLALLRRRGDRRDLGAVAAGHPLSNVEKRRYPRDPVDEPVVLMYGGGETISARMVDVSGGGARIVPSRTVMTLRPGDQCRLISAFFKGERSVVVVGRSRRGLHVAFS